MASLSKVSGVIPPLLTPLTDDRRIDEPALRRLVRHVLEGGVHGVFVMGSSGEFPCFDRDDRRRAIEIVADAIGDRVPVFAGISDAGTELAVRNAQDAVSAGADAVVLTMPYYFRLGRDEDVFTHYRHVAGAVSRPLVMYNIPQTAKTMIGVDAIAQLAEEGTISAIKDSSTDFNHFQKLVIRMSGMPEFRILQGSEFQMAASMLIGAHGGVLGISNIIPGLCVQLYDAAARGDVEQARELQRRVTAVAQVFWAGEGTLSSLKTAASMLGLCGPAMMLPMPVISEGSRDKIREILRHCRVIV
ncbi:MAG: dihydrodipicolinate synthase family protein [Armatimonadetes bacterium]|nr:dihydrodipicolinate synthase family protein [Armatimonadota bacterium]